MPIRRFFLSFPKRSNVVVRPRAFRTLRTFTIDLVEAALMKGVFAKKVHCGQVETTTAC